MTLTRLFLCSREWKFSRADGSVIAEKIRFRRDGTIVGYTHPNEACWQLEMGILVFCRKDGVATTRFGIRSAPGPVMLQGKFLFDETITHILTEVGRVPMPKYEDFREHMYAATEELRMIPVWPCLGQPLLLGPEQLVDFTIMLAGISLGTPRPQDLLRVLQAGSSEMELGLDASRSSHPGIYGPLGVPPAQFLLRAKEVVNITAYSSGDDQDPPRSSRAHQYRAGLDRKSVV
jgi:hypothetical protein